MKSCLIFSNDPSLLNAMITDEKNKISAQVTEPTDSPNNHRTAGNRNQKDSNKVPLMIDPEEEASKYPACLICFQPITPIVTCNPAPCEHQLCKPCVVQYIEELIKANKVKKTITKSSFHDYFSYTQVRTISCPTGECKNSWNDHIIKSFLTNEQFTRYEKLKKLAEVNADASVRWCIRPGCEKYNKGSAEKPYICCECGQEMCFNCSLAWHPKKTCEKVKIFPLNKL